MKKILILFTVFSINSLSAQFVDFSLPATAKLAGKTEGNYVIFNETPKDNNVNVSATVYNSSTKSSKEFAVFSYQGANNPNWKDDNETFKQAYLIENGIAVITYHHSKNAEKGEFEVSKLDLDGKPIGAELRIPNRRYKTGQYEPLDYIYYISPDKSKLAIVSHSFEKKLNEMVTIRVIDLTNGTLLNDQDVMLKSMSDRSIFDDFAITNEGTVYQLKYDSDLKTNFVGVLSNKTWKEFEVGAKGQLIGDFFPKPDGSMDIVGTETGWDKSFAQIFVLNVSAQSTAPTINYLGLEDPAFSAYLEAEKKMYKNDPKYGKTSIFKRRTVLQNPVTKNYLFALETIDTEETSVGTPERPINNYVFNTKKRMLIEVNATTLKVTKVHYDQFNNGENQIGTFSNQTNEYQGFKYLYSADGNLNIFYNTTIPSLKTVNGAMVERKNLYDGSYLLMKEAIDKDFNKIPANYLQGDAITAGFKTNPPINYSARPGYTYTHDGKFIFLLYAPNKLRMLLPE